MWKVPADDVTFNYPAKNHIVSILLTIFWLHFYHRNTISDPPISSPNRISSFPFDDLFNEILLRILAFELIGRIFILNSSLIMRPPELESWTSGKTTAVRRWYISDSRRCWHNFLLDAIDHWRTNRSSLGRGMILFYIEKRFFEI